MGPFSGGPQGLQVAPASVRTASSRYDPRRIEPRRLMRFPIMVALITPLLCVSVNAGAAGPAAAATQPTQHDPRMDWWRNARFGMFIHWGLYAIPAGEWNGKTSP